MFVHDSAALLFHGISAFSLTDKRNGLIPASSKGRKERYKRKSASIIFGIFTESRGSIRCIIKKSAAARAPYLPAGVPRYSMIKGFVVVTNWIRTSASGSNRPSKLPFILIATLFTRFPSRLKGTSGPLAWTYLPTLLVDQLQS